MNIALILSGGTGTRLGSDIPKQYIEINGRMLITYCLDMFSSHSNIDGIWIVANDDWRDLIIQNVRSNDLSSDKIIGFSEPGANRQLSILNGLRDIKGYLSSLVIDGILEACNPVIIIHDAARPNLTASFIDRALEQIKGHDGVMPVLPMKDTVYLCDDGKSVSGLLDRSKIYAGQAPELYYLDKYLDANERLLPDLIMTINGSTEPAIIAGLDVAIMAGDENNYKVTTKNDLEKFKKEHL